VHAKFQLIQRLQLAEVVWPWKPPSDTQKHGIWYYYVANTKITYIRAQSFNFKSIHAELMKKRQFQSAICKKWVWHSHVQTTSCSKGDPAIPRVWPIGWEFGVKTSAKNVVKFPLLKPWEWWIFRKFDAMAIACADVGVGWKSDMASCQAWWVLWHE